MSRHFTCPQGHQWDAPLAVSAREAERHAHRPICTASAIPPAEAGQAVSPLAWCRRNPVVVGLVVALLVLLVTTTILTSRNAQALARTRAEAEEQQRRA